MKEQARIRILVQREESLETIGVVELYAEGGTGPGQNGDPPVGLWVSTPEGRRDLLWQHEIVYNLKVGRDCKAVKLAGALPLLPVLEVRPLH